MRLSSVINLVSKMFVRFKTKTASVNFQKFGTALRHTGNQAYIGRKKTVITYAFDTINIQTINHKISLWHQCNNQRTFFNYINCISLSLLRFILFYLRQIIDMSYFPNLVSATYKALKC